MCAGDRKCRRSRSPKVAQAAACRDSRPSGVSVPPPLDGTLERMDVGQISASAQVVRCRYCELMASITASPRRPASSMTTMSAFSARIHRAVRGRISVAIPDVELNDLERLRHRRNASLGKLGKQLRRDQPSVHNDRKCGKRDSRLAYGFTVDCLEGESREEPQEHGPKGTSVCKGHPARLLLITPPKAEGRTKCADGRKDKGDRANEVHGR